MMIVDFIDEVHACTSYNIYICLRKKFYILINGIKYLKMSVLQLSS